MIKYICPIHGEINAEETFSIINSYGSIAHETKARCFRCLGDLIEKILLPLEKLDEQFQRQSI